MKAIRRELAQYSERKRDNNDRRKFVTWAVFSYVTDNGEEYRRAFTSAPYTPELDMWGIAPKEINV